MKQEINLGKKTVCKLFTDKQNKWLNHEFKII